MTGESLMKTVSLIALALSCWLLTACQGSSNSGAATTTTSIANNCVRNNMGQMVNPQTGMACNTGINGMNGQCVMTAQGYYINQMTGQICNQAQAGYGGGYGAGYGGAGLGG